MVHKWPSLVKWSRKGPQDRFLCPQGSLARPDTKDQTSATVQLECWNIGPVDTFEYDSHKKSKWNFFGYFFSYLYYVRCTKWIYGRNLTSDDINTIWFIDCTSQNDSQESVCMIKPNCQQQKLLLLLSFAGYSIYFNFLCLILISSLFVAIKNNFR